MYQTIMTVAEIIAKWPSAEQFADDIGLKWRSHARVMKVRNSIARVYWHRLVAASIARGTPVTLADLESAHAKHKEAAE